MAGTRFRDSEFRVGGRPMRRGRGRFGRDRRPVLLAGGQPFDSHDTAARRRSGLRVPGEVVGSLISDLSVSSSYYGLRYHSSRTRLASE